MDNPRQERERHRNNSQEQGKRAPKRCHRGLLKGDKVGKEGPSRPNEEMEQKSAKPHPSRRIPALGCVAVTAHVTYLAALGGP